MASHNHGSNGGVDLNSLAASMTGLNTDDSKSGQTKAEKKKAQVANVIEHFDNTYGRNETRLDMWQQLCRDVVVEVGRSIRQCKKNLQGIYLNIVDYVRAKQQGHDFRRFASAKSLSQYIKNDRARRIFPREEAKKNPILRWMLIHL